MCIYLSGCMGGMLRRVLPVLPWLGRHAAQRASSFLYPFHCWASKEPLPSSTRFTVGLAKSLFRSLSRFTVGLERHLLLPFPVSLLGYSLFYARKGGL